MATLKAIFKLYDGYSSKIMKIDKNTEKATNTITKASGVTDKYNRKLDETGDKTKKASLGLGKFIGAATLAAAAVKGMNISDEYTNTAARLNLINDGLRTQAELQEQIFAAADRSRGSYNSMADAVAKLRLNASDAFRTNDEAIAFTELLQKSFKLSGSSATEQASAMLQLTQALSSGRLQGDEFRSIMENAPMVADAIAKYMGKSKGELKDLSKEGAITASIIKGAMFTAADDINNKFATMPMTFGDIWTQIKNSAIKSFSGVIESTNDLLNTDGVTKGINAITTGIELAADAVGWLVRAFAKGWKFISPVLAWIAGVALVVIIQKLWAMIPPLYAQAAAWIAAHWPIILVVGLILTFISVIRLLGVTWEQIFSVIGGIIGIFYTFLYNKFVRIWNGVAALANFFGNVFKNPVASIKVLFYDLASTILGYFSKIAKGIEDLLNKIPGIKVDITSGLDNLKNKLEKASLSVKSESEWVEYVKSKDFMDYSEGYAKGSNIGKNLYNKIDGALGKVGDMLSGGFDKGTSSDPLHVTSDDKLKVDMSDEDLQYLRDIARREYINKFTTATLAPNVSISFGDVHEEADVDKIHGRISQILREEIAMVAEGAYS